MRRCDLHHKGLALTYRLTSLSLLALGSLCALELETRWLARIVRDQLWVQNMLHAKYCANAEQSEDTYWT